MADTITFNIPNTVWLSQNRHTKNYSYLAARRRILHEIAEDTAREQNLVKNLNLVALDWEIRYPKCTSRADPVNAAGNTKALLDGLVNYGLIPDDGSLYVVEETFRRGKNLDVRGEHQIHLIITDQEVPF